MLDYVKVTLGEKPTFCVIWLHGLGADGHDFESLIPELKLPENLGVEFIFPHAPIRPITINGGLSMRGWYDILSLDSIEKKIDVEGIKDSVCLIQALIDEKIENGFSADKIILAGFSQGGVIATYTVLLSKLSFAGLIALSTYLPGLNELQSQINSQNLNVSMPITIAHGLYDPIVPFKAAEHLKKELSALGFSPEFHTYPIEHSLSLEEIIMLRAFLLNIVNAKSNTL